MSSHGLLLRLFLSNSFFSVHVALQYLAVYSDNIGITYYLTSRLRQLETEELQSIWGIICHLLISRPSKSRALEIFVIETSQRSAHIAMMTLWFMQASLKDFPQSRYNSRSFTICQRALLKCHEIIFGDILPSSPRSYLPALSKPSLVRTKIKHHAEPAIVGIGTVLAGAPGLPILTEIVGMAALEQGRAEDGDRSELHGVADDDQVPVSKSTSSIADNDGLDDDSSTNSRSPSADSHAILPSFARSTISAARTSPALPLYLMNAHKSTLSDDPLGQRDYEAPSLPSRSTPSLPSTVRIPTRSTSGNTPEDLLKNYDRKAQSHLLRSHYCRSELEFLMNLENICSKLLIVPRPARVSALRAELTAINHQLPFEVCMPMWCRGTSTHSRDHPAKPHHRIVRIPPGESVVLNSAERAPYVLLIEILNDDLDFDPTKRHNKALLEKIVTKETGKKLTAQQDSSRRASAMSSRGLVDQTPANPKAQILERSTSVFVVPPTPVKGEYDLPPPDNSEEEIDLVEQLYGGSHNRKIDLSDTIVVQPKPKNREFDMMTWSRSNSIPPSPSIEPRSSTASFTQNSPMILSAETTNEPFSAMSLDEYSERMRTAAIMLAQLHANQAPAGGSSPVVPRTDSGPLRWLSGSTWLGNMTTEASKADAGPASGAIHPTLTSNQNHHAMSDFRMKLPHADAMAIRDRIMKEMLALEEERMQRMHENMERERASSLATGANDLGGDEDESIIRRELNKADPSAVVFSESWANKKSRIRNASPYGHLANWDCVSVIVKTGDLRQEQLAVQLIREFGRIWQDENCPCWVRYFHILITGSSSGLVETMTDAVSIHSIKKAEYARRLAAGKLGHVSLLDHFKATYGDISSAKFARAQRNFAKSLAGYSIVTFLLQIKDRHNGNILLDRDGHLIHIDFGFMLSNSPGNIGFEAAPFKLSSEYIEVLGGIGSAPFLEFRRQFHEGFKAARKHCDRIITLVELMQKDSTLDCFVALGDQTANQLRDRFQPALTHSLIGDYIDKLIDSSLNSNWTRLYDSFQYYSQSIL